jgi:serine/threonine protein kinase
MAQAPPSSTGGRSRDAAIQQQYVDHRAVGQGTFGTVMLARDATTGEPVAIKKVIQDPRFKNRELQIMRILNHPNVVALKNYYYVNGDTRPDDVFLNVVMEFVPDTLHRCCRNYVRARQYTPMILVKVFLFQLLRSIGYLHLPSVNVCHRDIKPHNVLVNVETGQLKICDFGSAKQLTNKPNVAYICSRYYRAPELIFGNQYYSTAVDVWSVGCIFAEMLIGEPIFRGENSMGQLVEIIKILGTPGKEQLEQLNRRNQTAEPRLAQIRPRPWSRVFPEHVPVEAHDLISKLLAYVPTERVKPMDALCHPFFAELSDPNARLPNAQALPAALFVFTEEEKRNMTPQQLAQLVRN